MPWFHPISGLGSPRSTSAAIALLRRKLASPVVGQPMRSESPSGSKARHRVSCRDHPNGSAACVEPAARLIRSSSASHGRADLLSDTRPSSLRTRSRTRSTPTSTAFRYSPNEGEAPQRNRGAIAGRMKRSRSSISDRTPLNKRLQLAAAPFWLQCGVARPAAAGPVVDPPRPPVRYSETRGAAAAEPRSVRSYVSAKRAAAVQLLRICHSTEE